MSGVEYSEQIAREVCERVAKGRSINSVCKDSDMPVRSTFYEWISTHSWLADKYARARELRAEVLAEEIIEIADNAEDANKARLQVDARKWAASKLDAKRYGDKTEHLHGATDTLSAFLNTIGKGPVLDRKSTRLNSSHVSESRMPSSA